MRKTKGGKKYIKEIDKTVQFVFKAIDPVKQRDIISYIVEM